MDSFSTSVPTVNFRDKFIHDMLKVIGEHKDKLSDWEKGFVEDCRSLPVAEWKTGRFNRVHDIHDRVTNPTPVGGGSAGPPAAFAGASGRRYRER